MTTRTRAALAGVAALAAGSALAAPAQAAPVVRSAAGANPAEITATVNQFRADLGNPNNGGTAGSQAAGRREINWDGTPDGFAAPANLPGNFFNSNSPRGVVFSTPGSGVQVSMDDDNPVDADPDQVEFDDLNPGTFQTFSAERLFAPIGSTVTDVHFFVPGSQTPATSRGFGVVFTDVDGATNASIQLFDAAGNDLGTFAAPPADLGLSFVGVSFDAGERAARARIRSGNTPLGTADGGPAVDVVAMDDFLYGEPAPSAQLSAASYSVDESAGTATVTVNRTGADGPASVDFATQDGTAGAGGDYTATAGTLTFAAGQSSASFGVPVVNDVVSEGAETFNVALSNPSAGLVLASPSTASVRIVETARVEPPAPGPAAPAAPADERAPALRLAGVPRTLRLAQLLRGFTIRITPDEAASLEVDLLGRARGARLSRAGDLVLASSSRARSTARRTIRLRASRRLLRGAPRRFSVRLRVTGTDAAGNRRTVTRTIRVRR